MIIRKSNLLLAVFAIALILSFQIPQAEASVTTVSKSLPTGRSLTSAVWDGSNAYIFGGWNGSDYLDDIVQFNPTTGTVTKLASVLPTGRIDTSAVWDGSNAYIFGGSDGDGLDDIVQFNPTTGAVTLMTDTLPTARYATSAVWGSAYIFGGWDGSDYLDDVVKFDPPGSEDGEPRDHSHPVGGFLTSTNKLSVLAPYLSIMGLVAAIASSAIIMKRRKD